MITTMWIVVGILAVYLAAKKSNMRIPLFSSYVDVGKLAALRGLRPVQYKILVLLTEPHKGLASSFHIANRLDIEESIVDSEIQALDELRLVMILQSSDGESKVLITPHGEKLVAKGHVFA